MQLRPIEPRDNAGVKHLVQTALEAADLAVPGTAYFDPSLDDLFTYYAVHEHARYWVITDEERVIGGVGIAPFTGSDVCELQKLYVDAGYRGHGFSDRLMQAALLFARQYYQTCYLETYHTLTAALGLYQKWDFTALPAPLKATPHATMDRWFSKKLQ